MKCLLLIDIQVGFCPGGHLAVAEGDEVVPIANRLMREGGYDLVVASQDWHPADHGSFASQHPGAQPFTLGELGGKPQMLWPDHCVQGTRDAEFHPDLDLARIDHVQRKGMNRLVDSYSAFRDNDREAVTGLAAWLAERGVVAIDLCGLATDYCVRFSALDAREMLPDARVRVFSDACRGITPDGVTEAEAEMRARGVTILTSREHLADV